MKEKKKKAGTGLKPKLQKRRTARTPTVVKRARAASAGPVVRAKRVQPKAVPRQEPALPAREILRELQAVRALLENQATVPDSADAVLEGGADALRRFVHALMEKRTNWILTRLVSLRAEVEPLPLALREMDDLLEELGAIRFQAEAMDHVDPLIHTVVEERETRQAPEGVIVETVRPGYRTGAGTVLAKACVAVSRRA